MESKVKKILLEMTKEGLLTWDYFSGTAFEPEHYFCKYRDTTYGITLRKSKVYIVDSKVFNFYKNVLFTSRRLLKVAGKSYEAMLKAQRLKRLEAVYNDLNKES